MFKLLLAILLASLAATSQTHQHATPDSPPVDLAKVPAPQRLDGIGQSRHALANGAAQMILDGNTAYFGQSFVYLQVAAVGRQKGQADGGCIIDQL